MHFTTHAQGMGDSSQRISMLQLSRHGQADPEEGNPKMAV